MKVLRIFYWVFLILLIIGGLNWGLVIFDYDVIQILFSEIKFVPNILYGLVAVAAIYVAIVSPLVLKRKNEL